MITVVKVDKILTVTRHVSMILCHVSHGQWSHRDSASWRTCAAAWSLTSGQAVMRSRPLLSWPSTTTLPVGPLPEHCGHSLMTA